MTHNVSRRTLAKGAAWAAPAVVATTAIPAYAASSTCSTAAQYEEAMTTYFADFASKVPDLSNTKLRLWYANPPHVNGGGDGLHNRWCTSRAGTKCSCTHLCCR